MLTPTLPALNIILILLDDDHSLVRADVARMLADEADMQVIGELSPKTVYSYRCRIFEKLGISSDVELTIPAIKHGLTEDNQGLKHLPQINAAG